MKQSIRGNSNPAWKYCINNDCEAKFYPSGRHSKLCLGCHNKSRLDRARAKAVALHEKLCMTVTKHEHNIWKDTGDEDSIVVRTARKLLGRYYFVYSSDAGTITLVNIQSNSKKVWEITMDGRLGKSKCERFTTKREALARIKELLI